MLRYLPLAAIAAAAAFPNQQSFARARSGPGGAMRSLPKFFGRSMALWAQHRLGRVIPSLFRRPVPRHARRADLAMEVLMRSLFRLAVAMSCITSPAYAHAFLERAEPPVGSKVSAPPHELVLTFTEGVEPLFTTVQLRDAGGVTLATGKPHTDPSNDRRLIVELPTLHSGTDTVIWHATSVDTHKTDGQFHFTVAQ